MIANGAARFGANEQELVQGELGGGVAIPNSIAPQRIPLWNPAKLEMAVGPRLIV